MRFVVAGLSSLLILCGCATSQTAQVPDSVMQSRALEALGVGTKPPDGAIVLFGGAQGRAAAAAELQAKWVKWRDWPKGHADDSWKASHRSIAPAGFAIASDPEFPGDTNRVTLRTVCATAPPGRWGYDDIVVRPEFNHGDARIHVEWIAMGRHDPGHPENPDKAARESPAARAAPHYANSGVYVQNRYEIQILPHPRGEPVRDLHGLGALVDEHTPATNPNTGNGRWQSYDIVFRTARWRDGRLLKPARMSVWWNGVLVHDDRAVAGKATGLRNTSGEPVDETAQGLKLQCESGDVRFRNVWMKHLKLDSMHATTGSNGF
jgi:hypothetical protein